MSATAKTVLLSVVASVLAAVIIDALRAGGALGRSDGT